jgi:hypothetical protein
MARGAMKVLADGAYVIKQSKIAGRGGFAKRDIAKGERILEYLGERISHAEADDRYDDHAQAQHHTFLFSVTRSVVIDGAVNGNDARFLNHSCAPNCEALIEDARVFIEAITDIPKDAELTYDYAYTRDGSETPDDEFRLYGCKCGAPKCRGTILAPLTKAQLAKRAAKAKRRRTPPHTHARTGHTSSVTKAKAKTKAKATSKAKSKTKTKAKAKK